MTVFSVYIALSSSLLSGEKSQIMPRESPKIAILRDAVDKGIEKLGARMIEMNDWMYYNPEPGFLEFKASAMLTEELRKHEFEVEMGVPGLDSNFERMKVLGGFPTAYSGPSGMPTAFKAKYKGKIEHPVIGFAVEYDALPGNPPFHGCQHNMQGPTGIGAAIALSQVMEKNKIQGSVWVIGTPAEEVGPPVKAILAKVGYLDGIDFMLRSHGTTDETLHYPGGFSARHYREKTYIFHGKSAHAQQAWEGVSALDAVMLLFHGVEMLREHSEPQFRFNGAVLEGGVAPNIVPERASAAIWMRHLMDETPIGTMSPGQARKMTEEKVVQIDNIAKGAALATGTKLDIETTNEGDPGISVGILNYIQFHYAVEYGGINIKESKMPNSWDETGRATLVVPGVDVSIGTEGIPKITGHSKENADLSLSPEGHKSLIMTSKVMGATALRLVMDPVLRDKAKAEHINWVKKYNE
jgi:amidohydrolase